MRIAVDAAVFMSAIILVFFLVWALLAARNSTRDLIVRSDRNAALTAAGIDGVRCFLDGIEGEGDTPENFVDKCFEDYDRLTSKK
jgi:hypothetical protein